MNSIDRVSVELSVVLGTATMPVHQLLRMGRGAVIELDRSENDMLPVYANERAIAVGQVVVEGDRISLSIERLLSKGETDF
ncbi:MAG: FliM/FliN family flagellar motor switch protein [Rhodobiaceae bacterium]|nr:FliM/FliN family flagellar motor switch protein [Rhodobiaceae bacterium]